MTWLLAALLIVGLMLLGSRRHRLQNRYVRARSERHERMLMMISELLDQPEIVHAARLSGAVSEQGLVTLEYGMGEASEAEVGAVLASFLKERSVRQAVAKYHAKHYGSTKHEAMEGLMELVTMARSDRTPVRREA